MKLLVIFCLVAVVAAAPAPEPAPQTSPQQRIYYSPENVQLLRYENENFGQGNYRFAFEQTDGTRQEQQGQIVNEGREDESISVKGSFSWVGPDGVTYQVNYVADDNGYQPEIEQGPGGAVPSAVIASLLDFVAIDAFEVASEYPGGCST